MVLGDVPVKDRCKCREQPAEERRPDARAEPKRRSWFRA
jgi:hypothetical protein